MLHERVKVKGRLDSKKGYGRKKKQLSGDESKTEAAETMLMKKTSETSTSCLLDYLNKTKTMFLAFVNFHFPKLIDDSTPISSHSEFLMEYFKSHK